MCQGFIAFIFNLPNKYQLNLLVKLLDLAAKKKYCVNSTVWPWTRSRSMLHVWLGVMTEIDKGPTYTESRSLIGL